MDNPFQSCDCHNKNKNKIYRLGDLIDMSKDSTFVFDCYKTGIPHYYVGKIDEKIMGRVGNSIRLVELDPGMEVQFVF